MDLERVTISFTFDVDSNEIHPDTVAAMIYNLLLDTPGVANPTGADAGTTSTNRASPPTMSWALEGRGSNPATSALFCAQTSAVPVPFRRSLPTAAKTGTMASILVMPVTRICSSSRWCLQVGVASRLARCLLFSRQRPLNDPKPRLPTKRSYLP